VRRIQRLLLVSKIPLWVTTLVERIKRFPSMFVNRYPLYRQGCIEEQPLFILACGRSGNTLLRSMLTASDEIAIPPESYVIPKVIRLFKANNYLPWNQLCSLVIGEFQSYKEFYTWKSNLATALVASQALPKSRRTLANIIDCIYKTYTKQQGLNAPRWGDKTPINSLYARWIVKLYPEAYYIHLHRDPRAVAVSYRESGLYSDLESGLMFWKASNSQIEKVKCHNKFITLKYEQLLQNPKKSLKDVCEFLKLSYSDKMLDYYKHSSRLGDVTEHKHHRNATKQLDSSNADKWKSKLTIEEHSEINKLIKKYNIKAQYD